MTIENEMGKSTPERWLEIGTGIKAYLEREYDVTIPYNQEEGTLDVTELEDPHQVMMEITEPDGFAFKLVAKDNKSFIQVERKL